jgi:uncharacterized protein (TIGR02145 family)
MKVRIPLLFLLLFAFACETENTPPQALFTVAPSVGNIKTIFDLDASASVDPDGLITLLTYRWDVNGDGLWDMDFGPWKFFWCSFKDTGSYEIRLEVKDGFGAVTPSSFTVKVEGFYSMTDPRDGQVYPVVKLGSYWWFARNLNIGKTVDVSEELANNGAIEKYVYPGSDPESLYGGLYTWKEAMAGEILDGYAGICPPGWHIPSNSDWNNMLSIFRNESPPRAFTYRITNVWFVPDQTVTHDNYLQDGAIWRLLRETGSTGFDVVPVGYRNPDGAFGYKDYYFPGQTASFWTSSSYGDSRIRVRMYMNGTADGDVFKFADNPDFAFSIRCVRASL